MSAAVPLPMDQQERREVAKDATTPSAKKSGSAVECQTSGPASVHERKKKFLTAKYSSEPRRPTKFSAEEWDTDGSDLDAPDGPPGAARSPGGDLPEVKKHGFTLCSGQGQAPQKRGGARPEGTGGVRFDDPPVLLPSDAETELKMAGLGGVSPPAKVARKVDPGEFRAEKRGLSSGNGLPLCMAVVERLTTSLGVRSERDLFLKGPPLPLSEFEGLQAQLLDEEKEAWKGSGVLLPSVEKHFLEILERQDRLGCFEMSDVAKCLKNPRVITEMTEFLEKSGLNSLGEAKTSILRLCATLFVLIRMLVLLDRARLSEIAEDEETLRAQAEAIEGMPSWEDEGVALKFARAAMFVFWANSRHVLAYRLLELGNSWESFVHHFVMRSI